MERISALEKLVADLATEVAAQNSVIGEFQRSLLNSNGHNASLGSIYEFPQAGGGPIYFPNGENPYISNFAPGEAFTLPGTSYHTSAVNPNQGQTSLGVFFNSGDTAWMLSATALVLLMTMPGLALYYSGMVREKNVLACTMQIFTICCIITFLWMCFGYSLSFAPAYPNFKTQELFGNAERLWLRGMTIRSFHFLAPTIPESVFCTYQLTFAIITAALICGSFADRMNFTPMIIFISFWHLIVYCPLAHSNWHPQGFLKMLGVLDYAGGNVVHIASGASGLATITIVGNRLGFGKERFEPHNILVTFMGMCMLWVGWFGFNAGSACGANFNAGYAMLATHISTAVASLTWLITEWAIRKKPSVLGMISGAIAGLVCITPASGYVDMTGAFFIGFFGGPLCYFGAQLKHWLGFDDALDAFGVHAIGGIVGGIATGFFATPDVVITAQVGNLAGKPVVGVYYGGLKEGGTQIAVQLCGVLFSLGWAYFGTLIICKVVDLTIGLRVSQEAEQEGLDSSIHGEVIVPAGASFVDPTKKIEVGVNGLTTPLEVSSTAEHKQPDSGAWASKVAVNDV